MTKVVKEYLIKALSGGQFVSGQTLGEELNIVLDNTTNQQNFLETVGFTVLNILFDPEFDLISRNNNVLLSTDEVETDTQFLLYPNPTSEVIHIDKPDNVEVLDIKIYNTLGQLINQLPWNATLNTTSWSTGLLFIQFETNRGVITKSVLKN